MGILIEYNKQPKKYLEKVDSSTYSKIISAIAGLPDGDVVKLKGRDEYRLKIYGIRILFLKNGSKYTITKIAPRGDVYLRGVVL